MANLRLATNEKIKYFSETSNGTFKVKVNNAVICFNKTYKYRDTAIAKAKELEQFIIDNTKIVNDPTILVSEEHKFLLTDYKWSINKDNGYAQSNIDGTLWLMHRYIMIVVKNMDHLTSDDCISHKDGNKLNNIFDNLEVSNASDIVQMRKKKSTTESTSIYIGVFKFRDNYFRTQLKNSKLNLNLTAYYNNELSAAWQLNLWIDKYKLKNRKNDVSEPEGFVPYDDKNNGLPKNISPAGKKFRVRYQTKEIIESKYNEYFDTLPEAEEFLRECKETYNIDKINAIKAVPILRNSDNVAIIQRSEKKILLDILVDDEDYYDLLINGGISITHGYVKIKVDDKSIFLHRSLMNCTDTGLVVDHIKGATAELKKLDNRKSNLRIATRAQNAQNQTSKKGGASKYIGVSLKNNVNGNKWQAAICVNGKNIYLGVFVNEEDAARARDIATKKHFPEFGELNFKD